MASTGQASMQSTQPIHRASSIRATASDPWVPQTLSSGKGDRPVIAASTSMSAVPPGGQRLIGSPSATASAYGRHPA